MVKQIPGNRKLLLQGGGSPGTEVLDAQLTEVHLNSLWVAIWR